MDAENAETEYASEVEQRNWTVLMKLKARTPFTLNAS